MTEQQPDELRELARQIFARPEDAPQHVTDEAPPIDPIRGNVSPREGSNPTGSGGSLGDFVAQLFNRTL